MEQIIITHPDNTTFSLISRENPRTVTKFEQKISLLGDDLVNISVDSVIPLTFQIGDTITVYGRVYKLNELPQLKKSKARSFEYDLSFEGIQYDLIKATFLLPDGLIGEALTGSLSKFAQIIVSNANRIFPGKWVLGTVPDTDYKNLIFNNENSLQVIQRLCEEFAQEFDIVQNSGVNTIHFRKAGTVFPFTFQYGRSGGLFDLTRQNISSLKLVTRLYVFGGTKNLGSGYRNSRLCLPGKEKVQSYIEDSAAIASYGIIEGIQTFDDVIPTRKGKITSLGSEFYSFCDDTMDFDLNEREANGIATKWLIPGTNAKVHFNTGNLAGYEFEVHNYDATTKTFQVVPYTDENGYRFPSDTLNAFKFAINDEYVILDILVPDSYKNAAEALLLSKGNDLYAQYKTPQTQYSLSLNDQFIASLGSGLNIQNLFVPGDYIPVKDTDLGVNRNIRVVSLTRDLKKAYSYSLTLSDEVEKSTLGNVVSSLNGINSVIKTNDLTNTASSKQNWRTSGEVLNALNTHYHFWNDIQAKPTWTDKMGWDGINNRVTINSNLHVGGTISATEDVIAYAAMVLSSDVLANLSTQAPLRKITNSSIGLDYNTSQFELVTGALSIKAGIVAASSHVHPISDITGLQNALNNKSDLHSHPYRLDTWVPAWGDVTGKPSTFTPSTHTHFWADLTDKPSTFTPSSHTHSIVDTTGLQTALDGKAPTHTHPYKADTWFPSWSEVTGKPLTFSPSAHSHAISDVTGLQTALDGKAPTHTHPYRPDTWVPNFSEILNQPTWISKMGWDVVNSRVTISTDLFVTGNIAASQDVIAYAAAVISSDVLSNLSASSPLRKATTTSLIFDYNTSQFELVGGGLSIRAGVLAPSAHTHSISDVSGLQTALNSKSDLHSHPYRVDTWVPTWSEVTGLQGVLDNYVTYSKYINVTNLNTIWKGGFYSTLNAVNAPYAGDGGFIAFPTWGGSDGSQYGKYTAQIYCANNNPAALKIRATDSDGSGSWYKIWNEANLPVCSYANGSTVVLRDAAADIQARYYIGEYVRTTDDVDYSNITYLIGKGGDNYHRSYNYSKVRTFLGLGTAAYEGISRFISNSPTMTFEGTKTANDLGSEFCFSYGKNTPYWGVTLSVHADDGGTMQFNTYWNYGTDLAFRTYSPDRGVWNDWRRVWSNYDFSPDVSASANSVVQRNYAGNIFTNFINTSDAIPGENEVATSVFAKFGDNYHRSATASHIKTFLGLGSNAFSSTAYLPLNGGTLTGRLMMPSTSANGYIQWNHYTGQANSRRWWIGNDYSAFGDFAITTESTQGNSDPSIIRFYISRFGEFQFNGGALPVSSGGTGAASLGTSLTNSGSVLNTIQDIRTSASPTFTGITTASGNGLNTTDWQVGSTASDRFFIYSNPLLVDVFNINPSTGLAKFNRGLALGLSGLLKGNGASAVTAAVSGTDYVAPWAPLSVSDDLNNMWRGGFHSLFSVVNAPFTGDGGMLVFPTWNGNSGGTGARYTAQIYCGLNSPDTLRIRSTDGNGYGSWYKIWNSSNFTPSDYTLVSTFNGHSHNRLLGDDLANLNDITALNRGVFQWNTFYANAANLPASINSDNGVLTMQGWNGGGVYGKQIAFVDNDELYFRQYSAGIFYNWRTIWHNNNSNLSTVNWAANNITAAGNITAQGDVIAFSDTRLKTNIRDMKNCLSNVLKLNSIIYNWNGTGGRETVKDHFGYKAQEIEKIFPEVVYKNDDYLGIAYQKIIPVLSGAIKELSQQQNMKFFKVESEVEQLKKEVARLKLKLIQHNIN